MTDSAAERRLDAMAYVCGHLDDIRTALDRTDVLEEVLVAVDAGRDAAVDESLQRLHTALQVAGDALGIYGNLPGAARGLWPIGVGRQSAVRPDEVVYLCPANTCSRYWWPRDHTAPPRCALHGQALRRDRL